MKLINSEFLNLVSGGNNVTELCDENKKSNSENVSLGFEHSFEVESTYGFDEKASVTVTTEQSYAVTVEANCGKERENEKELEDKKKEMEYREFHTPKGT